MEGFKELINFYKNLDNYTNDITGTEDLSIKKHLSNISNKLQTDSQSMSHCEHIVIDGESKVFCHHIQLPKNSNNNTQVNINTSENTTVTTIDRASTKYKKIDGVLMGKWGDKWFPVCDGSGFPYVQGCFSDMSNWTSGPKQCIITDPASPSLQNGSLYTCGFLW